MLEKTPYTPTHPPSNPDAEPFVPKFIYRNPTSNDGIQIKDEFFGTRKKLRIGVLGAGISTLNLLHYIEESIPKESVEIVVWEKNTDVGGVWLTTRYPGARCDIPGYMFQFSWRGNQWSEFLPAAEETLRYLQTVTKERDFYRYMKFRREVVKASWTDEEAKWRISIKNVETGEVEEEVIDLFIELQGPVSNPQITIPGIEDFKGDIVHTANWDESIDLKDKKVALLGYGSSGVQIAPNIISQVSKLYTWFRHRTYINAPAWPEWASKEGANFKYTEEQQALLRDPAINAAYQAKLDEFLINRFPGNVNGSPLSQKGREAITNFMRTKLSSHPEIFENIVPLNFDPGCRRATFSHGYIETLTHPKTTVFFSSPTKFTAHGFLDENNTEHPIDIIIAATGYDQSHAPRYPKLINNTPVQDLWAPYSNLPGPPSYMSLTTPHSPNNFTSCSAYAHVYGSWFHSSETTTHYITSCITKIQTEHIRSLRIKPRAVEHFVRHAAAFLERMTQSGPCAAWYKNEHGRPMTWPGSRDCYRRALKTPRWEDYEIEYEDEGDMFSYFGNGFTELDGEVLKGAKGAEGPVPEEVLEKLKGIHATAMPVPGVNGEIA